MQRSIMSFFYPKKEDKTKKPEKETSSSIRETEPPPKVALKERNREVPDSDSPVKRPGRKAARVLCSEGEEEDEARTSPKSQKPALDSPQVSPPSPVTFPESSRSLSSTSAVRTSPSGIPKRRTARKQLSKRTIENVLEEQSEDKDGDAKRKKEEGAEAESLPEPEEAIEKETEDRDPPTATPEPPETCRAEPPTESSSEPGVAVKQEPQEEDPVKPPRAPRTLSSFFTPRKPAVKKEVKEEEESVTPRKGEPKGLSRSDVSSSPLDPCSYNPAKNNYHPVEDACWGPGQK